MKKQSKQDRLKRLSKGCCPIHGLGMTQVGTTPKLGHIAKCPRKDCEIKVYMNHSEDEAKLLPEFEILLLEI